MTSQHEKIWRLLLAAQVALVEHMDEDFSDDHAKKVLQQHVKDLKKEIEKLD
jgi:hypothetical protein